MNNGDPPEDFQRLHALIIETGDIGCFLNGMTRLAADMSTRSAGAPVQCAVTLNQRKHNASLAGSSDNAILLDGVEQRQGRGPCHEAMRTLVPVLIGDVATDPRWPEYCTSLAGAGYRSALAVPLELGRDAAAALNFFAPTAGLFTPYVLQDIAVFATTAGHVLRLVLRISTAERLVENLKAALESRTVIDLACGIVMAQNECTQGQAVDILRRASNARNLKLHVLAEAIIASFAGTEQTTTHFDD
jgi:GAF domain-containing protein